MQLITTLTQYPKQKGDRIESTWGTDRIHLLRGGYPSFIWLPLVTSTLVYLRAPCFVTSTFQGIRTGFEDLSIFLTALSRRVDSTYEDAPILERFILEDTHNLKPWDSRADLFGYRKQKEKEI